MEPTNAHVKNNKYFDFLKNVYMRSDLLLIMNQWTSFSALASLASSIPTRILTYFIFISHLWWRLTILLKVNILETNPAVQGCTDSMKG